VAIYRKRAKREGANSLVLLVMVLSLITLICVEVVFDAITSVQFISVPFKLSLTGSITALDTSGRLPGEETLEKVNVIEFTSKYDVAGTDSELCKARSYLLADVSPSGTRKKLHSNNVPGVVHVISS
jgi:hypothetical protein